MKMIHKNSARKLIAAAVMLAAVATLSVGAFAAGDADAAEKKDRTDDMA